MDTWRNSFDRTVELRCSISVQSHEAADIAAQVRPINLCAHHVVGLIVLLQREHEEFSVLHQHLARSRKQQLEASAQLASMRKKIEEKERRLNGLTEQVATWRCTNDALESLADRHSLDMRALAIQQAKDDAEGKSSFLLSEQVDKVAGDLWMARNELNKTHATSKDVTKTQDSLQARASLLEADVAERTELLSDQLRYSSPALHERVHRLWLIFDVDVQ